MIPVFAKLHRCAVCGKWSPAKKQPKRHTRFIRKDIGAPEPSEGSVIKRMESEYDYHGDEIAPAGWRVWCGPFVTYDVIPEYAQHEVWWEGYKSGASDADTAWASEHAVLTDNPYPSK